MSTMDSSNRIGRPLVDVIRVLVTALLGGTARRPGSATRTTGPSTTAKPGGSRGLMPW
jgi:hypothetical protein